MKDGNFASRQAARILGTLRYAQEDPLAPFTAAETGRHKTANWEEESIP
jgi:hypothetical protein